MDSIKKLFRKYTDLRFNRFAVLKEERTNKLNALSLENNFKLHRRMIRAESRNIMGNKQPKEYLILIF